MTTVIPSLLLQACSNSKVQLAIDIVPVGAGYFLNGTAAAELPLQCDCCLATFYQPLQAPLKVSYVQPVITGSLTGCALKVTDVLSAAAQLSCCHGPVLSSLLAFNGHLQM
jgi:hypothetical protein